MLSTGTSYHNVAISYIMNKVTKQVINMAKAASPIRLQNDLMNSAKLAAKRFHRSTAEQIEYWADIGRQTSNIIDPDVIISLMSGLVKIKVEPIIDHPINPNDVFKSLEKDRSNGHLTNNITSSPFQYQVSETHPNYLEQIGHNGVITIGQFDDGIFRPLKENAIEE